MNPDAPDQLLEIADLSFSYPGASFELTLPELSLTRGEKLALAGASGSGKTTLLHLAAGILSPASGRVTTCGTELTGLDDEKRRAFRISQLGLVFQEFELLDYLNVLENILLPYRINRTLTLGVNERTRASDLLESLGLGDLAQRRPKQLSHGQRQRVAVCRALVTQPQLVLADEPTANLDPENKERVLAAFDRYLESNEAALLVTTHDEGVQAAADRVVSLPSHATTPEKGGPYER